MALALISSQQASSSSSLTFSSGIDSTYDIYEFHFVDMHPSTDMVHFQFQVNSVGGSGFNETITSTAFTSYKLDSNSYNTYYEYNFDQPQGTSYQALSTYVGSDADQVAAGILTLYAPSSTTYVKHFSCVGLCNASFDGMYNNRIAGYINTTSAIDEINFKFSSGNIDAGSIHMYGHNEE